MQQDNSEAKKVILKILEDYTSRDNISKTLICGTFSKYKKKKAMTVFCPNLEILCEWEFRTLDIASKFLSEKEIFYPEIYALEYGDILLTNDYRGTGRYFVGKNRKLIPSIGEYGYYIPAEFSDAPIDYYSMIDPISIFIDYSKIDSLHESTKEYFKNYFKEYEKIPKYFDWNPFEKTIYDEYEDSGHDDNSIQNDLEQFHLTNDKFLRNEKKKVKVIIFGTLSHLGLPHEILIEISEFVI